jgi:hypothetical protein
MNTLAGAETKLHNFQLRSTCSGLVLAFVPSLLRYEHGPKDLDTTGNSLGQIKLKGAIKQVADNIPSEST